jgi:hypothetical protein
LSFFVKKTCWMIGMYRIGSFRIKGYFRVIEQKHTDKEGETHINLKTLVYQYLLILYFFRYIYT